MVNAERRVGTAKVANCPKCSLRYTEISIEAGHYEEAAYGIEKASLSLSQPRNSIHGGYLYYLSGLLKLSKILKESNALSADDLNSQIMAVYADFNIALPFFRGSSEYKLGIKDKTNLLKSKYNVSVPAEMENLAYII